MLKILGKVKISTEILQLAHPELREATGQVAQSSWEGHWL